MGRIPFPAHSLETSESASRLDAGGEFRRRFFVPTAFCLNVEVQRGGRRATRVTARTISKMSQELLQQAAYAPMITSVGLR